MKIIKIIFFGLIFVSSFSCDSKTYTEVGPTTSENKVVTYANDVKAIIDNNCISCHSVGTYVNQQPYLKTYQEVKAACMTDLGAGTLLCRIEANCAQGSDPMPLTGYMTKNLVDVVEKWALTGYTN